MALKWREISVLLEEARPLLLGSALQKISQLKDVGESFSFQGYGNAGPWRIWTCLLQNQACWVLAEEDWPLESLPEPTTLVMVLRKHLMGKKILRLQQQTHKRIVLLQ
jgi:predicted ribosome quality control (RQC) complex YloA/Tae2 family protein